ncbi:MAG: aldose epimerase, partial [Ilumatobacteraceae bacterium]|nr:aldose epimerase [Ilumatobacteraceae bacterium]
MHPMLPRRRQNRWVIELRASGVTCLISPDDGGRIAQLTVEGRDLLVARPDTDADPISWGSYPMVPWGGRVRDGRFAFDDHEYQLDINHPPHSIHGTVWFQPWSVRDVDSR